MTTTHKNAVFIERYQQLIRVMKSLTPEQREREFDMGSWVSSNYCYAGPTGTNKICSTTMCAAGWAGVDPWFKEQGFELFNGKSYGVARMFPKYRELQNWKAVEAFFDRDDDYYGELDHPVFTIPETVDEVITAAEQRIKELEAA